MTSPLRDRCIGRWPGILTSLGIERRFLTNKHGPCPHCGGKDRFRFDNKGGAGTWFCSQCGAGDGFGLLELVRGWDFAETAKRVEAIVGKVEASPVRKARPEEELRAARRRLWQEGKPIEAGDPVATYLAGRGIVLEEWPRTLRYVEKARFPGGDGGEPRWFPAMVAAVQPPNGGPAGLHRTFLSAGGAGKADVDDPRRMMRGEVPKGSSVRLGEAGPTLGIAEGVETALSASILWQGMSVWSALNARMLAAFEPPEGVEEVWIFGDNDGAFAGQAAAYALAHRLAAGPRRLRVHVELPDRVGWDFNDVLLARLGPRLVPAAGGALGAAERAATVVGPAEAERAPAAPVVASGVVDFIGLRLVENATVVAFGADGREAA